MEKKQSRREFLKTSGTIILVMGGAWHLPTHAGLRGSETARKDISAIPASDGYLLVDIKKCQGCASCMLACSLVHDGVESLSLSRIQIIQNPYESFPADLSIAQCRQCTDPACVKACPADALKADPVHGHVRMVHRDQCIGCDACFASCPFQPARAFVAPDEAYQGKLKSRKCDLCAATPYHWEKGGGGPKGTQACVAVCPVGAIQFTPKIPSQTDDAGYNVNLRGSAWARLGYPTD